MNIQWSARLSSLFACSTHEDADKIDAWRLACEKMARPDLHPSCLQQDGTRTNLYLTPHAHAYFGDILPEQYPENSKVPKLAIVTDMDLLLWHYELDGMPYRAFDDIEHDIYEESDPYFQVRRAKLWSFFEKKTRDEARHTPVSYFYKTDWSAGLMVLPATQTAEHHIRRMAGVGCLTVSSDISDKDIHTALMHHEWFHLSDDSHLTILGSEIEADRHALTQTENQTLIQTWLDARVVGGFMWPLSPRQNGLPLIDNKFQMGAFQETQMDVVYDWCDQVFRQFYNPKLMTAVTRGVYRDSERHGQFLSPELHDFFAGVICSIHNDKMEVMTLEEFDQFFATLKPEHLQKEAYRFVTQAYTMQVQVSNSRSPEFYGALLNLSRGILKTCTDKQKIKRTVHKNFQQSLERLCPDLPDTRASDIEVIAHRVQLPGVDYGYSPLIERQMPSPL